MLLWDFAREVGASVLTYELYPLSVLGTSVPAFPSLWTAPAPEKRPILFVHGIFHNRSAFIYLKHQLARRGWHRFREVDLFTSIHSVPRLAGKVKREVENLRARYQVKTVDIVAHSMGGVVARYYIQKLGGDGKVANLITLGTPHQGTAWSRFSVLAHIRELAPASKLLQELNEMPAPLKTRVVTIAGKWDLMMMPKRCTEWKGTRHIELKRVGHAGLLYSRRVVQILTSHL